MQKTKGVTLIKPGKMDYRKITIPALRDDFALVAVHSAVINPSDWYVLSGDFVLDKDFGAAMGCEGSGYVMETGKGCNHLKGKRVAFHASSPGELGAFAENTVVHKSHMVILPEEIEYLHGSYFFINPWSVETIIRTAKKNNWKSLVHTAAASALGRMLVHACKENDINLVNIVRRQEQVEILKGIGATIILNSQEPDFVDKMEEVFDEYQPEAFYDAVTGPVGTKVFKAMPTHTTICMYGRLDHRGYDLDDDDLEEEEFEGKELRSFSVFDFTQAYPEYQTTFYDNICKGLIDGKYKSQVQAEFEFKDFDEAFALSKNKPTKGKVFFVNKKFAYNK